MVCERINTFREVTFVFTFGMQPLSACDLFVH